MEGCVARSGRRWLPVYFLDLVIMGFYVLYMMGARSEKSKLCPYSVFSVIVRQCFLTYPAWVPFL